jgi:hypothetical protein
MRREIRLERTAFCAENSGTQFLCQETAAGREKYSRLLR